MSNVGNPHDNILVAEEGDIFVGARSLQITEPFSHTPSYYPRGASLDTIQHFMIPSINYTLVPKPSINYTMLLQQSPVRHVFVCSTLPVPTQGNRQKGEKKDISLS